jgi:N-terminal domain of (some) glycogen debranching enzymes
VLVSEPDGQITWPSEKGLYFLYTRVVSNWAIYANDEPWELLNFCWVHFSSARSAATNGPNPDCIPAKEIDAIEAVQARTGRR